MKLPFKSALVTGGAGFIGSHLVEALVSAGCKVAVLDNLSSGNTTNLKHLEGQFSFFQEDIRNRQMLEAALEGCEVIFHLAAVVSVPQTVENPVDSAAVNDMGTLLVLDTARQKEVKRVVFSSSCAVYGDDPRLPKRENMAPKPLSPYAAQKLAAEYYAKVFYDLYGIETAVLRYFNVYGPRQDPSSPYSGVISLFMTKALLNDPAKNAGGQVMNIGSGRAVRINQLWQAICALSGQNLKPEYAPKRPGDIVASLAGMQTAKELLDFECEVSFEKGLESTFEWYRNRQRTEDRGQMSENGKQKT
jgi:UDP-glucose 4-epimerase